MTLNLNKFFPAVAIAAIASVTTLATTLPAEALTITRSTGEAGIGTGVNGGGDIKRINFNGLGPENPFPAANFDGVEFTGVNTRINRNDVLVTSGENGSAKFFFGAGNFADYFGVRVRNYSGNDTITFLRDADVVDSFTLGSLFTRGPGNYLNFWQGDVSKRFNAVLFENNNPGDLRIDDIAYSIPTPAMLPGMIGAGIAFLRQRKRTDEQAEQA